MYYFLFDKSRHSFFGHLDPDLFFWIQSPTKKMNSPLSLYFLFAKKYRWFICRSIIFSYFLFHQKIIRPQPGKKLEFPLYCFIFSLINIYSWFICLGIYFKPPRFLSFKNILTQSPAKQVKFPSIAMLPLR